MISRASFLRTLRFLALLIQVALPSLGVVADARLELAELSEPIHVESEDHECDSRGHPSDCAICHYLRAPLLREVARPQFAGGTATKTFVLPSAAPVRAGQRSLLPARAPPQLS